MRHVSIGIGVFSGRQGDGEQLCARNSDDAFPALCDFRNDRLRRLPGLPKSKTLRDGNSVTLTEFEVQNSVNVTEFPEDCFSARCSDSCPEPPLHPTAAKSRTAPDRRWLVSVERSRPPHFHSVLRATSADRRL